MSRLEYELLREQEPQLRLATWDEIGISPIYLGFVKSRTREELISAITAAVLRGTYPPKP